MKLTSRSSPGFLNSVPDRMASLNGSVKGVGKAVFSSNTPPATVELAVALPLIVNELIAREISVCGAVSGRQPFTVTLFTGFLGLSVNSA